MDKITSKRRAEAILLLLCSILVLMGVWDDLPDNALSKQHVNERDSASGLFCS